MKHKLYLYGHLYPEAHEVAEALLLSIHTADLPHRVSPGVECGCFCEVHLIPAEVEGPDSP